jgi:hypothetical protein
LNEAHPVKQWWEEPDKTKTGTLFTGFTGAKSTNTDAEGAATENSFFFEVLETHENLVCGIMLASENQISFAYWYKITNTDAEGAEKRKQLFSKF